MESLQGINREYFKMFHAAEVQCYVSLLADRDLVAVPKSDWMGGDWT
jgi:hypothetical protein